jgi:hypothetical protein
MLTHGQAPKATAITATTLVDIIRRLYRDCNTAKGANDNANGCFWGKAVVNLKAESADLVENDSQQTFGRHLLSSGRVLELPIGSHARQGAGLFPTSVA